MMAKKINLKSMFALKELGVEGLQTRTKVVGVRRCGSEQTSTGFFSYAFTDLHTYSRPLKIQLPYHRMFVGKFRAHSFSSLCNTAMRMRAAAGAGMVKLSADPVNRSALITSVAALARMRQETPG